jgi:Zn finger protein HypA/HybF involved in hydrogenase expression
MHNFFPVRCIRCNEIYETKDCKTRCPNCGYKPDCNEGEELNG